MCLDASNCDPYKMFSCVWVGMLVKQAQLIQKSVLITEQASQNTHVQVRCKPNMKVYLGWKYEILFK